MLTQLKNSVLKPVRQFHEEEDGMEALQVVIIVAIAAVVLLAIKVAWSGGSGGGIKKWFEGALQKITSWTS